MTEITAHVKRDDLAGRRHQFRPFWFRIKLRDL